MVISILRVALGLEYLHSNYIVHGDLRGVNTLPVCALCRLYMSDVEPGWRRALVIRYVLVYPEFICRVPVLPYLQDVVEYITMIINFGQYPLSPNSRPEKVNMSSKCQARSTRNSSKETLRPPCRDPALGEAHERSSKSESSTSTRACARTSQALRVVSLCAYRDLFTFMLKFFGKNDSITERAAVYSTERVEVVESSDSQGTDSNPGD